MHGALPGAAGAASGARAQPAPTAVLADLRGVLAGLGERRLVVLGGDGSIDAVPGPNPARTRHLAAVVGTACLLAVGGCAPAGEAAEDTDVVTAELLAEPADHVGETLAVEAVVGTVITDNAFTIVADAGSVPEEDPEEGRLVVLAPRTDLEPGDRVAVEGVVREYLPLEELEDRFGTQWTDLMGEEYGAEPFLDATSLEQVGG